MRKSELDIGVTRTELVDHGPKRRIAPITFRVGEVHQSLIESRAQLFGQTPNHYAKTVVVRDLEQRSINEAIHREMATVRRELSILRQDVRRLLKRRDLRPHPFPEEPLPANPLGELLLQCH